MRVIYRHMGNIGDRRHETARQTGTIALKVPTYLKTMLTAQFRSGQVEPITINLGLSLCHKDDMFNKRVGRELAESRMSDVNFRLVSVDTSEPDHINYFLTTTIGDAKLDLTFREYRDSMNIRLVDASTFSQRLWDSW